MKSYTPLANTQPTPSLALAIQIVGTIESHFGDYPFPHIDFEFEFSIDLESRLPISVGLSLLLVWLSVFVDLPPLPSFAFVLSNASPHTVVVFYPFESFFPCSSLLGCFSSGHVEMRTRDLLHATQTHYQLCYIPLFFGCLLSFFQFPWFLSIFFSSDPCT